MYIYVILSMSNPQLNLLKSVIEDNLELLIKIIRSLKELHRHNVLDELFVVCADKCCLSEESYTSAWNSSIVGNWLEPIGSYLVVL